MPHIKSILWSSQQEPKSTPRRKKRRANRVRSRLAARTRGSPASRIVSLHLAEGACACSSACCKTTIGRRDGLSATSCGSELAGWLLSTGRATWIKTSRERASMQSKQRELMGGRPRTRVKRCQGLQGLEAALVMLFLGVVGGSQGSRTGVSVWG